MQNDGKCRQCGNVIPEDSPQELCDSCLTTAHAASNADTPLPDGESKASNLHALASGHPKNIGPFKILEVLGQGGMGVVYLAEQEKPIRRRVALKLIKLGMDTKEVIARFESERQALALMNHPNIARVLDAGVTEKGSPYFVMEHIAGIRISDYCDRFRLNTRERLDLFMPVCQAVQHAHQKGIIHRDLKPSNVLVTLIDGKPVPKVIDFGVAKATNQRLTEQTVFTQQGLAIGTPEYMSPEQAEMTGLDVDNRTDIYSMGVMLYELLVGSVPFDSKLLRKAGFDEMRRIIREQEPPTLTGRLRTLGDTAKQVAYNRHTDPESLGKQLQGDLEWIALKAMDKDRIRRYQSAAELEADICRHLNEEMVMAIPPSTIYRLRKFARRRRGLVTAAAVVLVSLTIGLVLSTILYIRAEQQEKLNRSLLDLARMTQNLMRVQQLKGQINSAMASRNWKSAGEGIDELIRMAPDDAQALAWRRQVDREIENEPVAVERKLSADSIGMQFVTIPSGKFIMGCSAGDSQCEGNENPRHEVTISRSFELGKHEVTQEQWVKLMVNNRSYSKGDDRLPVENLSWNDAQAFIAKLNALNDGYRYRLPTEAEWEYAARGGTAGSYYGNLDTIAWYVSNSRGTTHHVGQKQPNGYGLYDMLGNVWEWCSDWYGESYYGSSPAADPKGPSSGQYKVLRGGSLAYVSRYARVSSRLRNNPGYWSLDCGFRVCREKL
jgi:formylglycine-generating enzyme required for sulfatase activity